MRYGPVLKLFSIFLLLLTCTCLQAQKYYFRQYSQAEGLNHTFAYALGQDDMGFLWIGTNEGAYRFDGFSFEHFTMNQGLAENFVSCIFQHSSGSLWFGHQAGSLSVFEGGAFREVGGMPEGSGTIMDMVEGEQGMIWIVAQNSGLITIGNDGEVIPWESPSGLSSLTQVCPTGNHQLLLGTLDGLFLGALNPETRQIEILETYEIYQGLELMEIIPSKGTGYFILSRDEGIYWFKPGTQTSSWEHKAIDENGDGKLDNLQGGILDTRGRLWVISMGNGVLSYQINQNEIYVRTTSIHTGNGLVSENVRTLFEDYEGNIWMGFYGKGIARLAENDLSVYTFDPEEEYSEVQAICGDGEYIYSVHAGKVYRSGLHGEGAEALMDLPAHHLTDRVHAILMTEDGTLWLGFDQAGLFKLRLGGSSFEKVFLSPDELSNSVNHLTIYGKQLWLATKKGICRMDLQSGVKTWFTTRNGLPHNNIRQLYVDHKGRVLLATLCGQVHFLDEDGKVGIRENSRIGPLNSVVGFAEDNQQHLWVITQGNGVFQLTEDSVYNYTTVSGLHSDYCYSISISADNKPVIGHTGGISVLDPVHKTTRVYGRHSGIPNSTEFYQNAIWTDPEHKIWFGTSEGLIAYQSGSSSGDEVPPRIHVRSVRVNGEELPISDDEIVLKPGQYELAVEYIGLSFTHPEEVLYQTQLEGFTRDWSKPTYSREVVYDQVGHGSYVFRLKAYNLNKAQSELEQAFSMRIKKPFYLAAWFYLLALTLLVLGIYTIFRIRERYHMLEQERLLKNLDEKTKELIVKEEIIKEREKVEKVLIDAKTKAEQSEKLKTSFLQNMSHEIRTPMNAIVGFSGLLKQEDLTEPDRKEYIESVNVNAAALLSLIDDILDLSKLETDQLILVQEPCNLHRLFRDLEDKYLDILKQESKENIGLSLMVPDGEDVIVSGDYKRIRQILDKLLDNAVKFTDKGDIRMGFTFTDSEFTFLVEDTGIGLSEDEKKVIFDLFHKIDDNKLKLYGGTGLGLTFARYLVNMMGGEIDLKSHEGFGSKFFFTLPLERHQATEAPGEDKSALSPARKIYSGRKILVVEDTDSNFRLIKSILSNTGVKIKRAITGEEALKVFFQDGDFDLVIMDMKLPGLDGYQTTRMIRIKDKEVPIISHTAYALEGDREKSLEVGCDDYLPKPTEKSTFVAMISSYLN